MTTRKELVELARAHLHLPGVSELVIAIDEVKNELDLATWQLYVRTGSAMSAKEECSYQDVGTFMEEAAKYDRAAHTLKSNLFTLACILQKAGFKFDY